MPLIEDTTYKAPKMLSNPHLATLIPSLLRFPMGVRYSRERVDTPDGDFLDLDWSKTGSERLVIFSHGLEGSSRSKYILGMVKYFNKRGWDTLAWNFRSCSGEPNLKAHFYHPGQTEDFQLVVDLAEQAGYEEIALVGFSLGGAYTLRYLGSRGADLSPKIKKSVVFSTPTDLEATSAHLSQGAQALYGRTFLARYKKKMMMKEKILPGINDLEHWENIHTMPDFDREYNARWYGFDRVDDFYQASNPKTLIHKIEIPTLVVNAKNDPFLPENCYPVDEAMRNPNVFLEIPEMGGHVGFMTLSWSGIYWSEIRTESFLNKF